MAEPLKDFKPGSVYEGEADLQKRVDYLLSEEAKVDYDSEDMSRYASSDTEALRIYRWWKHERPAKVKRHAEMLSARYSGKMLTRPAPEFGEGMHELIIPDPTADAPTSEEVWEMERQLDKDDEDNLIALIKIRGALWT